MSIRFYSTLLSAALITLPGAPLVADSALPGGRVLDAKEHHLGDEELKDWPAETAKPEGDRVELKFDARANSSEVVLAIQQRDVSDQWALTVNGNEIAKLKRNQDPKTFYYPVPAHTLKDGQNELAITPANPKDDMAVGPVTLYTQTFRELMRLRLVTVTVVDEATGKPVPARVTITDPQDKRREIFYGESLHTAVRPGVLYTRGTETKLELPEGEYVFYATRGMEWSRGRQAVEVGKGKPGNVQLRIRREVDTTGFVAADTHIHTLTFSGHGDASAEERMITLAAEGVELAIATDHNHNTDYLPFQNKTGMNDYFTAVTGNEVTTPVGHMNSFPLNPQDTVPAHNLNDWVALVDGIRAKGAKVVILNHPRWPDPARNPFTKFALNRASGDFNPPRQFPFDGMELANALTPQPDPLYLFRDWFALLNWGEKITGIGSSDSHTVGEPVGQGRSYVPSATDDPARINVDDACERFLKGETSIALGIFADVRVNERFKPGQLVPVKNGKVTASLRVAASSWVRPRKAILFINGQQADEQEVPAVADKPTDIQIHFIGPVPSHDAHLVCVVLGDGVSHPSWAMRSDFTLAATNPVYLDADGDGKYRSPRETAQEILSRTDNNSDRQWSAVVAADDVIAVQMISLLRERASAEERAALDGRVRKLAAQRAFVGEYLNYAAPAAGGN